MLALTTTLFAVASAAPRPHIVLMLTDNLGYGNVGFTRALSGDPPSPEVATPTLDALAAEGIILDRLYCYKFCSPSRSSFLSGRLPVHVNTHNDDQRIPGAGIPVGMTTLPQKLRDGGYSTHHIGKWHVGFASANHTPMGRGFDTSIGYLWAYNGYLHGWAEEGCEEFPGTVTYPNNANGTIPTPPTTARCTEKSVVARHLGYVTDLWKTEDGVEGPAVGLNASFDATGYEETFFVEQAEKLIASHATGGASAMAANATSVAAKPFFLYYAMHLLHSPLCAPPALLERFSFIDNEDRRYVSAMVAYLDEVVGRVVTSLKTAKMWDQTVFVWQSDNGAAIELTTGAKSAYPLRGGYYTNWEGGIRAPGFINGGYLIKALEQEQLKLGLSGEEQQTQPVTTTRRFSGLLHIADWYATFCGLAGVDPTDSTAAKAGLPPIDSIDMWPALTNSHNLSFPPPRVEIFASGFNDSTTGGGGSHGGDTALISGHYKLILGRITQASWCGKVYPNNSMHWDTWGTVLQCPVTATTIGCLFNIYADPTEHVNLAATPEGVVIAKRMYARLLELQKGVYSPDRGKMQTKEACASAAERGGFWGPWMSKA